jgi:hypothetical protein
VSGHAFLWALTLPGAGGPDSFTILFWQPPTLLVRTSNGEWVFASHAHPTLDSVERLISLYEDIWNSNLIWTADNQPVVQVEAVDVALGHKISPDLSNHLNGLFLARYTPPGPNAGPIP